VSLELVKKKKKKERWKKREGAPLSACFGPFYFNLGLLAHPRQNREALWILTA